MSFCQFVKRISVIKVWILLKYVSIFIQPFYGQKRKWDLQKRGTFKSILAA